MPTAKIHVHQGSYAEQELAKIGEAIQGALENVLRIPPEDYFRVFHVLPDNQFVHTPGFVGETYTNKFILLDLTFLIGRTKETKLALLSEINARIVGAVGIAPDDIFIALYELPGENISFGHGLAQRANIAF